jgi:GNAT superfamily N-acetyltransferase
VTAPASLWKIGQHWTVRLGCSIETLSEPAVAVVPHDALSGWHGAFFFRHGPACVISVPQAFRPRVEELAGGAGPEEIFSVPCAEAMFGLAAERIIGPAWLGYADTLDFRPVLTTRTRALGPDDLPALQRLSGACGPEWEDSGITFESPLVFGRFAEGELVAAGTVERTSRDILNIGIVTHPDHRGQGYGKEVVSALTHYGIERGGILQYRSLEVNNPSMRIARALGYQSYGRTIAVRLKQDAATS